MPDDPTKRPFAADEIATLEPAQRRWLEEDLLLREKARALAAEHQLDESEVYHQLKQLRRDPVERLRRGLAHGGRRPRLPDEG